MFVNRRNGGSNPPKEPTAQPQYPFPLFHKLYGAEFSTLGGHDVVVAETEDLPSLFTSYGAAIGAGHPSAWNTETKQIKGLHDSGALVLLAHIIFQTAAHWTSGDMITQVDNCDGVQITGADDDLAQFDAANTTLADSGKVLRIFAGSDYHTKGLFGGGPCTYAFVETTTAAGLLAALKAGRVLACDGSEPVAGNAAIPADFFTITEDAMTVKNFCAGNMLIRFIGTDGAISPLASETVIPGGTLTYTLTGTPAERAALKFVRAQISDTTGFSPNILFQPVPIEQAGDDQGKFLLAKCPYVDMPEGGVWVHGDTHTHEANSDGELPLGKMLRESEAGGLDFAIPTTHHWLSDRGNFDMVAGAAAPSDGLDIGLVLTGQDAGLVVGGEGGGPRIYVEQNGAGAGIEIYQGSTTEPIDYKNAMPGLRITSINSAAAVLRGYWALVLANWDNTKPVLRFWNSTQALLESIGSSIGFVLKSAGTALTAFQVQKSDGTPLFSVKTDGNSEIPGRWVSTSTTCGWITAEIDSKPAGTWVAGTVVALKGGGASDKLQKATAAALARAAKAYGLVAEDSATANVNVLHDGGKLYLNDWSALIEDGSQADETTLEVGEEYYLSTSLAGGFTKVKPSTSGQVIMRVGVPYNNKRLTLDFWYQGVVP